MFCYQCEQAYRGQGCHTEGVCGKTPEAAGLQDIIIHQLKGIGYLAHAARKNGKSDVEIDRFILRGLFITVTNVNFDPDRLVETIREAEQVKKNAQALAGNPASVPDSVTFEPKDSREELSAQAARLQITGDHPNEDIRSLQHLLTYGIKGLAAYAEHASVLGYEDECIFAFISEALAALNDSEITLEALVDLNMRCGQVNIRCMEILDEAHTTRFGHPEPTPVSTGRKKGPAIIITGHDLLDMEELLKQTEGKGINVYTHGEMLPAHGYPAFKKYAHFAGHFGTGWQNQQREFNNIPAAVYFTTNCIQEPQENYKDRVFTGGEVGWPGIIHIQKRDFSPVIEKALELNGFEENEGGTLLTGCGRNAVANVADKVVEAVKAGAIKHFFLVGGCDGAKPGRNYYTEFTQQVPEDCVILTLACGKFRFNHLDFGNIGGIPRLLDLGQCNDAYSAIKIAELLAGAFECGVNDLPLTLILSWYEQKAVVILLSLLSLGIKGIRLGPSLPAFITPNIFNFLVEHFDIRPISTPEKDLEAVLAAAS
ncbi:MAG: hydroxylamine reductase [Candidatus Omnitrophica bacterium]|nr:hydroxylamine reductase [Candidatus Omnitrophota bacterium]